MSNADNSLSGFGKLVPGFDFLQNLARQAAGSAAQSIPQLPNLGNWVAPTLNVEELDKRIQELKAVQFWLDQNAMALKATIQALEVQKMTLATLKGMNFNMGDVANAFRLKVADSVAGGVQHGVGKAATFSGLEIPPSAYQAAQTGAAPAAQTAPAKARTSKAETKPEASQPAATAPGVVDAMQWWGALTQQFQTIAADAMKEAARKSTIDTPGNLATGLAKGAMKTATDMVQSAGKTVAGNAQAAMNTALRSSQAWPVPVAAKTAARPAAKPQPKASARKSPRKTAR